MSTVEFEEDVSRHTASKTSEGTILSTILQASNAAGIDPVAELYNEALSMAQEGHYGQARARLQVLLGLSPSDGDAHLLLAKVHVAGQQWRRAIACIDEAAACGTNIPPELRESVIRHLQEDAMDDDRVAVRTAQNEGEMKKLRSEVRSLRSVNAHLLGRQKTLEAEASRWAWVATGTSVVAILLIVARLFLGGGTAPPSEVAEAPVAEAPTPAGAGEVPAAEAPTAVTAEAPAGAAVPVVRDPSRADEVKQALADAGLGAGLTAVVRGDVTQLAGTVPSAYELEQVQQVVLGLDGIEEVKADAVVNTAVRDGATYTVTSGDSLAKIASKLYGNEAYFQRIMDANPQLGGKTNLSIGQKLTIPAIKD